MEQILEMLRSMGLEPTRENIRRIARMIPGYEQILEGTRDAADLTTGAARAAADFGGRAIGEMAENPARGYGNYLRGIGSGALSLARFLPGEGRAEQAMMRLAGQIAPDEGSAQGSLGRFAGDMVPDLLGADLPLVPGRMAEAEGGLGKGLELLAVLPFLPGGMGKRGSDFLQKLNREISEATAFDIGNGNGGATFSTRGQNLFGSDNYVVAVRDGDDMVVPARDGGVSDEDLYRFYERFADDLADDANNIGTWRRDATPEEIAELGLEEGDQVVVLDVSRTFPRTEEGRAAAMRLARRNNQDAIFDLNAGEEISARGPTETRTLRHYSDAVENPEVTELDPSFMGQGPASGRETGRNPSGSDRAYEGVHLYDSESRFYDRPEAALRNRPYRDFNVAELNYPTGDAGRIQRLRESGYDTDTPLYHGTTQEYDTPQAKEGEFWATESPFTAQGYAEDAAEGLRGIPQRLFTDEFGYQRAYGHQIRPMYGREIQPTGPEGFSGPLPGGRSGGAWRDPRGVVMTTDPDRHLIGMFDDVEPPPDLMAPPPPRGGTGPFTPPSSPPPPDLNAPVMGAPYVRPTDMTASDRTYGLFDPAAPRLEATGTVDPLYAERAAPRARTRPFFDALRRSRGLRNILDADVVRGLAQLDGRPWYELGGLRQFAEELGDPDLFRRWNIIGSAASAQNSVPNEMSLASIINWANRRGITDYEEAGDAFRRITGSDNLPLISQGHFDAAQTGLERGLLLPSSDGAIHYNAASWKTPSYFQARQGAGNAMATLDTHERRRIWQYVMANRNLRRLALNPETGFTAAQIRNAENTLPIRNLPDYQAVSEIYERGANRFGLPSAAAYQAPRWTGGGVLTGLESNPTRTYQELLADQVLHTARQRGMDTSPAGLRRLLGNVLRGEEMLLPGTLR